MELWIRSQDRAKLCEARFFELDNDKTGIFCFNGESYSVFAGKYKTKERALEVLDEIQHKINEGFIIKEKIILRKEDEERIRKYFEETYNSDFIMQPSGFDIIPLNRNVFIYEMPEK